MHDPVYFSFCFRVHVWRLPVFLPLVRCCWSVWQSQPSFLLREAELTNSTLINQLLSRLLSTFFWRPLWLPLRLCFPSSSDPPPLCQHNHEGPSCFNPTRGLSPYDTFFLYQCCNAIRSPWLSSDTQALAECPFVHFHAEDVFAADALASEASLHSAQLFLFFSPGLCSRSFQGRAPKSHYLKMPVSAGTLYLSPAVYLRKGPSYLGFLVSRWFFGD